MFCPNCGNHILDANASFCPNCGAQLNSFTQGNDQSSAQQDSQQNSQQDFQQGSQQNSQQDFQQDSQQNSQQNSQQDSQPGPLQRSRPGTIWWSCSPRRNRTARRARLPQIITDSALQAFAFHAPRFSLTARSSALPESQDLFSPSSDCVSATPAAIRDAVLRLQVS